MLTHAGGRQLHGLLLKAGGGRGLFPRICRPPFVPSGFPVAGAYHGAGIPATMAALGIGPSSGTAPRAD